MWVEGRHATLRKCRRGDLSRFQNPRELMGYLGLVPSESSTGERVKRGGITKAGNSRARRILVEAAWSYRYPARVGREKQPKGGGRTEARTRDRMESANTIVRALPLAPAQGQAADGRRYGGCPRAIGLHLGDQSRGHANSTSVTSSGAVDRSSREVRSTGPQPLRCNQHQEG